MDVARFEGIRKEYRVGEQLVVALNGITTTIGTGEYTAIVGPSGSGKSTMMHILGLLDLPSGGKLIFDGEDVTKYSPGKLSELRNRKIGFVFQSFNLLPKLNVMENVELPLVYAGVGAKKRREAAMEAIGKVGLLDRVKNRPNQLSGGQAQRVAIARALVANPRLILADEPTGALDSSTGERILELFRELNRAGNTVVIVTHDNRIASECSRRIELKDGLIVRDDVESPVFEVAE